MKSKLEIYKGIHPGLVLKRELLKRDIPQGRFAINIQEFPQTINGIIKQRISINPRLSIKLGRALGYEESFFAQLQVLYDIEQELKKENPIQNSPKVNPTTFWDTDLQKLDWDKHKKFIIQRILQYGSDEEKKELYRFYGEDIISQHSALPNNQYKVYSLIRKHGNS